MKTHLTLITFLLLFCLGTAAQPPETVYQGTVITTGFKQNIPLASDGPFPIGFNFTFFGNTYTQFYVSANGLVTFTDPDGFYNTEVSIPNAATPNNYIAPFWDNLSVVDGGKILYTTVGLPSNKKCIIQFKNMGFDPIPTPLGTFIVILYENSNVIHVQYRLIVDPYSQNSHGGSATIGIENSTGTDGVLYSYHNGDAITAEQAISFTPSGGTYTVNPDAVYDGVYLTSNISLPDPGIVSLVSPPSDAAVGENQTFQWSAASDATSYILVIDTLSSLATANYYFPGLNLSYDVTGLLPDKTYFWAVFSTNATATTWCEIRRFTTGTCLLAAVPQTIWTEQLQDKTIKLLFICGDLSAKTATITSLPSQGELYQYNGGVKGPLISTVPTVVTDPDLNVIYSAPASTGNGIGNFNHFVTDGTGDSPSVTITVNVSLPPPNVLYLARGTGVEIQFDRPMMNPTGKQDQFGIKINGIPATMTSASLKEGDPNTIILTCSPAIIATDAVLVSYTQGDIRATNGGYLFSFTDQPATLLAQTINFPPLPRKKYGNLPFNPGATASSTLDVTYQSSNPGVATITGGGHLVNITGVGTSFITAIQTGNATYAPAKYTDTLIVDKGDQVITFNAFSDTITYGDPNFSPGAVVNTGLPLTYSSSDENVATIISDSIHITGGGSSIITVIQAGNSLWNPDTAKQTLNVIKADLTLTAEDKTRTYNESNPTFTYTISGFLFDDDESDLNELPEGQTTAVSDSPAGDYPITLSGGSDNSYNFLYVDGTLTITQASQTITITDAPLRLLVSESFTLAATSTSGLPVLFESLDPGLASITGDQITGIAKGSAQIRAYNAGDQNWLAAEAFATVEVTSSHRDIMNLFTPNGDGINDYWELPDLLSWGKCDVKVYNRWGKLVFDDPDYDNLWDGTSDGNPVPEGAYYFIIKTENAGTIKGTVNIVR